MDDSGWVCLILIGPFVLLFFFLIETLKKIPPLPSEEDEEEKIQKQCPHCKKVITYHKNAYGGEVPEKHTYKGKPCAGSKITIG